MQSEGTYGMLSASLAATVRVAHSETMGCRSAFIILAPLAIIAPQAVTARSDCDHHKEEIKASYSPVPHRPLTSPVRLRREV